MSEEFSVVLCIKNRFKLNSRSCAGSGSEAMADELERLLAETGLGIEVKRVKCLGQCEHGPNLRIAPGGRFYHQLSMEDLPEVIAELQRLTKGN